MNILRRIKYNRLQKICKMFYKLDCSKEKEIYEKLEK